MFYDFGGVSPNQPAPIRAAFEKMGQGAAIVIATDKRALAGQIEAIAGETGRADLHIVRDLPAGEGADWNDALRSGTSPTP